MATPVPDPPASSIPAGGQTTPPPLVHHDRFAGYTRVFTLTRSDVRIRWLKRFPPPEQTVPLTSLSTTWATTHVWYIPPSWLISLPILLFGCFVAGHIAGNVYGGLVVRGSLIALMLLGWLGSRRDFGATFTLRTGKAAFVIASTRKDDPARTAFVGAVVAAITAARGLPDRLTDEELEALADEPGAVSFRGRLTAGELAAFSHAMYRRLHPWRTPVIVLASTMVAIGMCLPLLTMLASPWPVIVLIAAAAITAKCLSHWNGRLDRAAREMADERPVTDVVVSRRGLVRRNDDGGEITAWPDVQRVDLLACGIHLQGEASICLPNRVLTPEIEAKLAELHRAAGVAVFGRR